jgi:hypothetical protein
MRPRVASPTRLNDHMEDVAYTLLEGKLNTNTMSLDDKENVADVHALRLELKRWEKEFVDSHDGRKPSREEIKRYPEIGAIAME